MNARTLEEVMERLRLHHYHLWRVMSEFRGDLSLRGEWRLRAIGGDPMAERKLLQLRVALELLQVSMGD